MKTPFVLASLGIVIFLAGCKLFGSNPAPPSAIEQKLFTTVTNVVPVTVVTTNTVTQTNVVELTNITGAVVLQTNFVTLPLIVTNTYFSTNQVMTPNDNSKAIAQTAGSLSNIAAPGVGGIVTGAIGMLLSLWGGLRSSKNTSIGLAQEVETVREFIKTLPNGTNYDNAITSFLQAHQVEAGVAQQVLKLLSNNVSNPEAVAAAKTISDTIAVATAPKA